MRAPRRIQRKRTKGWRMPDGAVYVGRPTRWGNPFRVGWHEGPPVHHLDREEVVLLYRVFISRRPVLIDAIRERMRGRDLVCWCPLDQPCHADVLLKIANSSC